VEQYFAGSVAVLARHALGQGRTLVDLGKRLAVGLMLVGRRRLGALTYLAALRRARKRWRRRCANRSSPESRAIAGNGPEPRL
jgi:hypothetical protein